MQEIFSQLRLHQHRNLWGIVVRVVVAEASQAYKFRCRDVFLLAHLRLRLLSDGEKKAKKRSYEQIRPDDDDFASQSSPAEPPQVLLQTNTECMSTGFKSNDTLNQVELM